MLFNNHYILSIRYSFPVNRNTNKNRKIHTWPAQQRDEEAKIFAPIIQFFTSVYTKMAKRSKFIVNSVQQNDLLQVFKNENLSRTALCNIENTVITEAVPIIDSIDEAFINLIRTLESNLNTDKAYPEEELNNDKCVLSDFDIDRVSKRLTELLSNLPPETTLDINIRNKYNAVFHSLTELAQQTDLEETLQITGIVTDIGDNKGITRIDIHSTDGRDFYKAVLVPADFRYDLGINYLNYNECLFTILKSNNEIKRISSLELTEFVKVEDRLPANIQSG